MCESGFKTLISVGSEFCGANPFDSPAPPPSPAQPITVSNKYGHVPCAELVNKTQMHALATWADDQIEGASFGDSDVFRGAVPSVSSHFACRQKTGLVRVWLQLCKRNLQSEGRGERTACQRRARCWLPE